MKNLYQTSARTRWDGSGGIFRKCAVLLLAVSLLPVTLSAAGSEPARSTSQTEVPPPAQGRAVSGTVRDGKGDPIPGAAVRSWVVRSAYRPMLRAPTASRG